MVVNPLIQLCPIRVAVVTPESPVPRSPPRAVLLVLEVFVWVLMVPLSVLWQVPQTGLNLSCRWASSFSLWMTRLWVVPPSLLSDRPVKLTCLVVLTVRWVLAMVCVTLWLESLAVWCVLVMVCLTLWLAALTACWVLVTVCLSLLEEMSFVVPAVAWVLVSSRLGLP